MAVPIFFKLFILIIISNIPQSLSQSNAQNIQTFYPFSPPPSPPTLPPPPPPPPATPTAVTPPPPPPRRSSTRAAVGRAIGVTAAATIVLSGLLFFFLLRRSRLKKSEEENAIATRGGTNPPVPPANDFTRFNGNIKGLIVDENGLDVLYWKDLQDGENRTSFKKRYFNLKDEQEQEQEKRMVSGRERKINKPPIQEAPLLRGKSSSSQSPIWAADQNDDNHQIMKKEPSFSTNRMSFKAVERQNSSIQLVKHATPPLPMPPQVRPPNSAPPPPPPQMAAAAVAKMAVPPPPPMPPGEGTSSDKSGKVKLKPLHWDKVNPNAVEHSMVWDKIDKGSFKFDGDLMEALFGYVATNRKSPQRDNRSSIPQNPGPPSQIFILDTRKSQNIAIVLKSLGITRKEIIDALIDGQGLNADTIEKLTKIAPSDEELSQITAFKGDPTRLADAESFLYHLLKSVPSAFTRFNAMLFRSNYDSEVLSIKQSLQSLELACNELRTRGLFFSDGKTTLLQFVVQEVVRAEGKRCVLNKNRSGSLSRTSSQSGESQTSEQSKDDREREYMMLGLPVVGGLSVEFSNVKKAANLDYDVLVKSITALSEQMVETRKIVSRCGEHGGFAREMNGFLDTAELEIRVIKEEQTRVMEIVKKTRDYYQTGTLVREKGTNNNSNNGLQLFVIVRDFLGMVDQVCIDIARNVQRRKGNVSHVAAVGSSSSSSLSPESPRVFRFPKLPANFMSDGSKSGSSDSDDDSEVRK
ncbi:formin-like protein 4 [Phtheirospermum japonicum]|uniref:Formin-like protein n=1 Tax=Phtheirospermum japonicum TaxID=374723 RepID=A0A830CM45_9LAMI|nr:formin-like protein 4 [Phtheirospermum japonicum]